MEGRAEERVARPGRPEVPWGALLAGAFVLLAVGRLLMWFGASLGGPLADPSDGGTLEGGGVGAVLWWTLAWMVAAFAAGAVAARLAGETDPRRGALHGLVLWSVGVVAALVLGDVAPGGAGASRGAPAQAGGAADGRAGLADGVRDDLERALADAAAPDRAEDARALDPQVLEEAAAHLMRGDAAGAQSTIESRTELPAGEVREVVGAVASDLQESWSQAEVAGAIEAGFRRAAPARPLAAAGREAPEAIAPIDGALLSEVADELIAGRPAAAKRALARETALAQPDVDRLIDGVAATVDRRVRELEDAAAAAARKAALAAQRAAWTSFVVAALALVACGLGGAAGARGDRAGAPARARA